MKSKKKLSSFKELRRHFARIGITQEDVRKAIVWARKRNPRQKLDQLRALRGRVDMTIDIDKSRDRRWPRFHPRSASK